MLKKLDVDAYVRREQEIYGITTKRTYAAIEKISYPQLFFKLAPDQQKDARRQLQYFSLALRQTILDEWQARCLNHDIRNPAAYLFGIIKKARADEFRPNEIHKSLDE